MIAAKIVLFETFMDKRLMQYDLFGRLESLNQIKKYKRNQISSGELLIVSNMTSNWKIVEIQNKISVLSTIIQKHEFLRA